jgi:hypothetical protein
MNKTQYNNLLQLQKHFNAASEDFKENYDHRYWNTSIVGIAIAHGIGGLTIGETYPENLSSTLAYPEIYLEGDGGVLRFNNAANHVFGENFCKTFYPNVNTYDDTKKSLDHSIHLHSILFNEPTPEIEVERIKPISPIKLRSKWNHTHSSNVDNAPCTLNDTIKGANQHLIAMEGQSPIHMKFDGKELAHIEQVFEMFSNAGHEVYINMDKDALVFFF